jgi:hypothetical protein
MKRLGLVLVLAACGGGSDADVNGEYTLSLMNRENGCDLPLYQVGGSSQTTLMIVQTDSAIVATVGVGGAGYLDSVVGAHVFTGSVDGDGVTGEIVGTRSQNRGNCAFTYNAKFRANADGDTLSGRVEYTAVTNGNPDCSLFNSCLTLQEFSGIRPPQ